MHINKKTQDFKRKLEREQSGIDDLEYLEGINDSLRDLAGQEYIKWYDYDTIIAGADIILELIKEKR